MIALGWLIIVVNFAVIMIVAWSDPALWQWPLLLANAGVIVLTWRHSLPAARRLRDHERRS